MNLKLLCENREQYILVMRNGRWIAIKAKELQNG